MRTQKVNIVNKLGLHARAAAKLVSTASAFASQVYLTCNGQRVNAKSIMGIMMLAAGKGSTVEVTVDGNDEDDALNALVTLIADRFGEEE